MNKSHQPNPTAPSETVPSLTPKQAAYIQGLRDLASFFEKTPQAIPSTGLAGFCSAEGAFSGLSIGEIARQIGSCEKTIAYDGDFELRKAFGPHSFRVYFARDKVCKKVVTGTKTITKSVPDPSAPPVPMVEVTEEVETFEWQCPDSILAETAEVA